MGKKRCLKPSRTDMNKFDNDEVVLDNSLPTDTDDNSEIESLCDDVTKKRESNSLNHIDSYFQLHNAPGQNHTGQLNLKEHLNKLGGGVGNKNECGIHMISAKNSEDMILQLIYGNNNQKNQPFDENNIVPKCSECFQSMIDCRTVLRVGTNYWHPKCLSCKDCCVQLNEKCYMKGSNVYCRKDFFQRFGTKCAACHDSITPSEVVRRAHTHVYHLSCFTCIKCEQALNTGDEFYLLADQKLMCKTDFDAVKAKEAELDNINKRPRTTITAKQLDALKRAYAEGPKPARHVREQLSSETGLDMRVVQVWFQNRRAKEKRLKKDVSRRLNGSNGKNKRVRLDSEDDDLDDDLDDIIDPDEDDLDDEDGNTFNEEDYDDTGIIDKTCFSNDGSITTNDSTYLLNNSSISKVNSLPPNNNRTIPHTNTSTSTILDNVSNSQFSCSTPSVLTTDSSNFYLSSSSTSSGGNFSQLSLAPSSNFSEQLCSGGTKGNNNSHEHSLEIIFNSIYSSKNLLQF